MTSIQQEVLAAFDEVRKLSENDPICFDMDVLSLALVEEIESMWRLISEESKGVLLGIAVLLMRESQDRAQGETTHVEFSERMH